MSRAFDTLRHPGSWFDDKTDLAKLGHAGSDGKPLKADGVAGPKTLTALQHAQSKHAAPNFADPKNPNHTLYEQALAGVHKLDTNLGRKPDQQSDQLAAGLVVAAKREGMTKIDTVMISEDGSRAFAVQGQLASPLKQIAHVQTAEAVNTPVAQSTAAAAQVKPPVPVPTPHAHALTQAGPTISM